MPKTKTRERPESKDDWATLVTPEGSSGSTYTGVESGEAQGMDKQPKEEESKDDFLPIDESTEEQGEDFIGLDDEDTADEGDEALHINEDAPLPAKGKKK